MPLPSHINLNIKIEVDAEREMVPKRRYKRPDLQRLANRWYGMKPTGFMNVRIVARPRFERIAIPVWVGKAVYLSSEEPERVLPIDVEEYRFHPVGMNQRVTESAWKYGQYDLIEMFRREAEWRIRTGAEMVTRAASSL